MTWGTVELEPEVREWLEQLPTVQFATAAFHIDLLAEEGVLLREPYTRQLDGKLRELRFHLLVVRSRRRLLLVRWPARPVGEPWGQLCRACACRRRLGYWFDSSSSTLPL